MPVVPAAVLEVVLEVVEAALVTVVVEAEAVVAASADEVRSYW